MYGAPQIIELAIALSLVDLAVRPDLIAQLSPRLLEKGKECVDLFLRHSRQEPMDWGGEQGVPLEATWVLLIEPASLSGPDLTYIEKFAGNEIAELFQIREAAQHLILDVGVIVIRLLHLIVKEAEVSPDEVLEAFSSHWPAADGGEANG